MPNLVSQLIVRMIDDVSGPSKAAGGSLRGLGKSVKDLEKLSGSGLGKLGEAARKAASDISTLEKIGEFRSLKRGLQSASQAYHLAQQNARKLASEMANAGTVSATMARAHERAVREVTKAKQAFMDQGNAVRAAGSALSAAGVSVNALASAQARLRASVVATNAALTKQAQQAQKSAIRKEALGTAASVGGVAAAAKGKEIGSKAVLSAVDYDYAVRRQRAFAGLSQDEQNRVLQPQARRIATDTKFSNVDVVEAQTTVASRLPEQLKRGDVIAPIIDQVKNYALSMKGTDMEMSAQAVTGFLQSTGKDISTAEKAAAESRKATNMLLRMAKLGGMSHDDLMPFVQRGASAGRLAGLSDETMGSLAIGMRRSNISGDQAGTALRTISAKLVSPTRKGLAALDTAGINYDDFVKMPGGGLSTDNLEKKFKRDFGKGFTAAIREKLNDALANEDIVGDRGAFTQAVTEAVAPLFSPKKDGSMKAADAQKVAQKVGEFHKLSAENVNSEALLSAIIKADPTLAILNAFATDKHGNKLGLIAKALDQYQKDREALTNTPNDFGDKISAEITGGLGGAFERLKGSVENLILSLGTANEKLLTPVFDKIGNIVDSLASLPEPVRQAASGLGLVAAASAGVVGAYGLITRILGVGGPSAALTGSAGALTQSAAALTAAAARLGAAGGMPDLPSGNSKPGAASAGKPTVLSRIVAGGVVAGTATAVAGAVVGGPVAMNASREALIDQTPGATREDKIANVNGHRKANARAHRLIASDESLTRAGHDSNAAENRQHAARSRINDAAEAIKPKVDTSDIKRAETEAQQTGVNMASALNIEAKPNVDTASIAAALQMAQQLISVLAGVGAASAKAAASVRSVYADYGVTE